MANRSLGQRTSVPLEDLLLDAENPRIKELSKGEASGLDQDDILKILWREFAVDEIALSMAANGYFEHEPLFAQRSRGKWVVIEGNRRLAAALLLTDQAARRDVGADLPRISEARRKELRTLPVIECKRSEIWQYVGFKHVNGPQAWQSFAKAQYIAWVHNDVGVALDQIAKNIGDQHATVRRLYRAYMALEQAEKGRVFDRDDRTNRHFSFSHLYTGLEYPGIQKFTGVAADKTSQKKPIPPRKLAAFGELCVWLYGSKRKQRPPLVRSQNPDLRLLDEVLASRDGVAALRSGLPLQVALEISKGDKQLLRESLITAKAALQSARGKLLSGYHGESDLLHLARDARDLAVSVLNDMEAAPTSARRANTKRVAAKRARQRTAGRSR
jgi:hypothetical protein